METASWTATLFSGGTVVATLNGFADGFDAGETVTVEFFGFDEYAGWDTIEFQVDFEVCRPEAARRAHAGGRTRRPSPPRPRRASAGGTAVSAATPPSATGRDDAGCRWLR